MSKQVRFNLRNMLSFIGLPFLVLNGKFIRKTPAVQGKSNRILSMILIQRKMQFLIPVEVRSTSYCRKFRPARMCKHLSISAIHQ